MSRYEFMLVFEKFGGCPWYVIPIRSGLLYDELKCILDDFAWLMKEGDTVDHFLQSSVLEGKPSRVLAGRGEKIDGSTRKELDEEVVVVWTKEGKPINHSVFNLRPFFVIYGDWKVPQRLLVYQEPSLYLWVIYVLVKIPPPEGWTSTDYYVGDDRWCMVVQKGTSKDLPSVVVVVLEIKCILGAYFVHGPLLFIKIIIIGIYDPRLGTHDPRLGTHDPRPTTISYSPQSPPSKRKRIRPPSPLLNILGFPLHSGNTPEPPSPGFPQAQELMNDYDEQYMDDLWAFMVDEPTPTLPPIPLAEEEEEEKQDEEEEEEDAVVSSKIYQDLFDKLLDGDQTPQTGGGGGGGGDDDDADEDDYFFIENVETRNCPKFHTKQMVFKTTIRNRPRENIEEAVAAANTTIRRLLQHVLQELQAGNTDYARLVIDGSDLGYPIELPFLPVAELTPLRVLRHLEAVQQSKRGFLLDGEMTVVVYHVANVPGSGVSNLERFLTRKREEPLLWMKTLAVRTAVVVCSSMYEAVAQFLHWRQHETLMKKRSPALCDFTMRVRGDCDESESAENLMTLLAKLNEYLMRDYGVRVVVLDWGDDERPMFVGAGDTETVVYLYKINQDLHLLLQPEKIQHSQKHQAFCRSFFFSYWNGAQRSSAHVCGESGRSERLSQVCGPRANRSVRCEAIDPEDLVTVKKSMIRIKKTEDGSCAFRAVVVGKWAALGYTRRDITVRQEEEQAKALCTQAGLRWGACGRAELTRLQEVLKDDGVRLHVYYHDLNCIGFAGALSEFPGQKPDIDVYLFHHDEHYDVITAMTGFLKKNYYCPECDVGYSEKSKHKCQVFCECCFESTTNCSREVVRWIPCPTCHRHFKSDVCYSNHIRVTTHRVQGRQEQWSVCQRYRRCVDCQKVVDLYKKQYQGVRDITSHRCGEQQCYHCRQWVLSDHLCHVQPLVTDENDGNAMDRFIFFDIETMPLEAVHRVNLTFNLPEEKGYFPHFFNRPENQNYVGPYPALEYYGIESMKESDVETLRQWHTEQLGKTFDLQAELKHYCQQDVILLKRGVMEARRIFLDVTGFDPFVKCITLASACMWFYRYRFMPPNSIGIIPQGGYTPRDIQSLKAKKWLWGLEQRTPGLRLHTCYSVEGETAILGAKVDGYDPKTRTVYQFHGCFWHACNICFPNAQMFHPKLRQKMGDIRNDTAHRTQRMREWGFKVVEMWEHEWDGMQSADNDDTFPEWMKHQEPLNPREGLFGGRTNALKLYFKCPEGSRVDYVDFTSLYPSVMLSGGAYPVGHPTLIRRDFQTPLTDQYYGLNKVKVLPPRHLYIPVLPAHIQKKLMFVLCRTCAEQLKQTSGQCCHNAEERALVGTWTTPELKKAIALGYVILDVYEVWHYPDTSTELFGKYVNTYLRLKQEASGWPSWCHTEKDRQRYVDEYFEHEGIRLEEVAHNPGLRNLVKLMLNSLWGKFGQNPHLPVTEYVDQPKRFTELMFGPKTEVKHLLLINENLVQLQYDRVDDFTRESGFASVVHAAFVTAFARLKLYSCLEELQERVLYFDTDSVFYVTHPGQTLLPLGDYLGDLTSELERPGDFIREFVSTGPKSYAYVTDQGDKEVKCKGIPLNVTSSAVVNFKSMLRLVEGMQEKYVVTEPYRIQRDAKRRQLKTVQMSKDFRVVYDKRVRRGVDTVPYGYLDRGESER
ncbi:hypothetical protein QZH41_020166 [Actinostola sp. cb2023]|nr:hypothetical protein QZH41_020166 [Actinostola sp. cb2023]